MLKKTAFVLCALSLVFSYLIYPSKPSYAEEAIPNEYIFEVFLLPGWRISPGLFAYESQGRYYLPIEALAQGFEFAVTDIDKSSSYIQGYASREENSFTIDGARNEIIVKGERRELDANAILKSDYLIDDDIYVQLEILNEIWPISMRVELASLKIFSEAEEDLSFMRNKERRDRYDMIEKRRELKELEEKILPRLDQKYKAATKPIFDLQGVLAYDTEDSALDARSSVSAVQGFDKVVADYSLNFRMEDSDIKSPDNARLKFTRQAEKGTELGFIPGFKRIEAGDIVIRQKDNVASSSFGRGISISSSEAGSRGEFDRITLDGTGPVGWEIEVYNNDQLVDFGEVSEDGRYLFEDIALSFGNNEIKILFFGPQGEVREESRSYTAGSSMLKDGDFEYEFAFLENEERLIELPGNDDNTTTPEGLIVDGMFSYGINEELTLFSSYRQNANSDKVRKYVSGGAAMSTPLGLVETELYKQIDGGRALSLNHLGRFWGIRENTRLAWYDDFESEISGLSTSKKLFEAETELNSNVSVFGLPLDLRFKGTYVKRENGLTSTDYLFAQNYSYSGLRLSNVLRTRISNGDQQQTTGNMTATYRNGDWQYRGNLNYQYYPISKLSSFSSEVRYKPQNTFQAAVNLSNSFETGVYTLGTQMGYDFDYFLGTFQTSYTKDAGVNITLRYSASLHPQTEDEGYEIDSTLRARGNTGAVKAKVFVDKDYDTVFSEGDIPLPGARLRFGGSRSAVESNDNGLILATGKTNEVVNISVDRSSLVDPYYVPTTEGVSAVLSRGQMIDVSFPIMETGSIEGTLYRSFDTKSPAEGVTLELVNHEGVVLQTTETGYDGYYLFEFVPPGFYEIKADKIHNVELVKNYITVNEDNIYVFGQNLYLDIGNEFDEIDFESLELYESKIEIHMGDGPG